MISTDGCSFYAEDVRIEKGWWTCSEDWLQPFTMICQRKTTLTNTKWLLKSEFHTTRRWQKAMKRTKT